MIYIAHRGLLEGPDPYSENAPWTIENALVTCSHAEIDLWVDNQFWLGHDKPEYKVSLDWLWENKSGLWIHCKNIRAMEFMSDNYSADFNFFWHEEDTVTLTSHRYIWAYPGKQPISGSIAVLPELYNDDLSVCYGICTDYVLKYRIGL